MSKDTRVVTVEIGGQRYPIRSTLDAAYVAELAAYVDEKLALASRESTTGDTLKMAVLAALNIADELFRARSAEGTVSIEWRRKAEELERLVDEVIGAQRSAS